MRLITPLFLILSLLSPGFVLLPGQHSYVQAETKSAEEKKTVWRFDFCQIKNDRDLQAHGFSFEKDMDDKKKIHLRGTPNGLEIKALKPAFGLLAKKGLTVHNTDTIEVEWGVTAYPKGADWHNTLNREALMVYLFFGEPVDADKFYLPDSPYFIGMFLCENEQTQVPYIGKNYKETGRYVCLEKPAAGKTIRSVFNFNQAYRQWFKTDRVPPITGIALEVDTTDLPEGTAAAVIKNISLKQTIN
ncbi:MAG: hypothetical protein CSA26_03470 [Desulfobacterales bacterium]|nr:MAG: hypothetical protein CSA26_03470 [Desulfobacterales bacterium]